MHEPARILLVDDEENILWSVERALRHDGFVVETASSVAAAREVLERCDVALVVTDLRLPDEDGFALLRWARARRPAMPVIMATAYGSAGVRADALRDGAAAYLEKPVDVGELVAAIRTALGPAGRRDARESPPGGSRAIAGGGEPVDTSRAVEIAPDVYWVGRRNPRSLLQCNVYLRVFRGAGATVRLLVDPGSPVDLPVISRKVAEVIGGLGEVDMFSVNHQDPDVVANSVYVQRMNPRAQCIASEDTWRLIAHYELDPARVSLVEAMPGGRLALPTGHALEFVPTPYCHFRGAVALYDPASRVLFTGDLFGGLSPPNHDTLYADAATWEGVRAFHQIYMPTRKMLRRAVRAIRELRPRPEIVAPQHGDILRGALIDELLERVADLPVGADLLDEMEDREMADLLRLGANELISRAVGLLGAEVVLAKLSREPARAALGRYFDHAGLVVTAVHRPAPELLSTLEGVLAAGEAFAVVSRLRHAAIEVAARRSLPIQTGRLELSDEDAALAGVTR
jgi:CheY-like chemotaxis protein/glyoxylase-like metal-dependent hydrolase (beta-lactamase superfamily II)